MCDRVTRRNIIEEVSIRYTKSPIRSEAVFCTQNQRAEDGSSLISSNVDIVDFMSSSILARYSEIVLRPSALSQVNGTKVSGAYGYGVSATSLIVSVG
jgi:hypothetical protein